MSYFDHARSSSSRAQHALDAVTADVSEWINGNVAAGGVCDFCGEPLDGTEVTWVVDDPIFATLLAEYELGETASTNVNYGSGWAACLRCDAEVEKGDAEGLVNFVMRLRPPELHESPDSRANLATLYRAFYESGARREAVKVRKQPKFKPLTAPAGNWKEAYEKQMELWKFIRSDQGKRYLSEWARLESEGSPIKRDVYHTLLMGEEHKLFTAPPVFVSEDMVDVIEEARQTWRVEPFVEEDLLLRQAFIYFARPVYLHDSHGRVVNVQAISYCPIRQQVDPAKPDEPVRDGIAVTFYSAMTAEGDQWSKQLLEIREWFQVRTELIHLHVVPVWFDLSPDGEEIDVDTGRPTGFAEWWSLLQVTFRLMMERISEPTEGTLDRHARKRGLRAGFDPRGVIVIHLRRHQRISDDPVERDVAWTHRWLVTGHWRDQWYPKLGKHRQRWIGGYVKGPDGKPLVVKRKVYQADR